MYHTRANMQILIRTLYLDGFVDPGPGAALMVVLRKGW